MKSVAPPPALSAPLVRRDLIAVLAYLNRGGRNPKCVDGSFAQAEVHLNRLAAAAGMQ